MTDRELDAIYGATFRDARDRGRDPTPAHLEALRAVADEVATETKDERALARLTEGETDGGG